MKKEKINNPEFVGQISKDTGYAKRDISAVLDSASKITLQNLNEGKETVVLKGLIVYPASYKDEVKFARARFGKYFKITSPVS